jgi:signal peptidase II
LRRVSTKLLLLILVLLAADQISKLAVRRWLDPHELIQLLPFFRLEHVQNRGIAFGMLDGHGILIVIVSVAIVLLLTIATLMAGNDRRLVWPLALLVAGSAGNLFDRIVNGSVTDFLHIQYWPAFNLADICIVAGVALLVMRLLFWSRQPEKGVKKKEPGGNIT